MKSEEHKSQSEDFIHLTPYTDGIFLSLDWAGSAAVLTSQRMFSAPDKEISVTGDTQQNLIPPLITIECRSRYPACCLENIGPGTPLSEAVSV